MTASTYTLYPRHEERLGTTNFYKHPNTHFIDYFNLIFYCGIAFLFFYYFVGNYDSMGYISFVFGIIIFCELMVGPVH